MALHSRFVTISIHAPRTGSDVAPTGDIHGEAGFQSTLPARGATRPKCSQLLLVGISIHAPRTGSDLDRYEGVPHYYTFQSTLPARGATRSRETAKFPNQISIHAPRTGSDRYHFFRRLSNVNFNPRSPHGERHGVSFSSATDWTFQSTLPARGATSKLFTS